MNFIYAICNFLVESGRDIALGFFASACLYWLIGDKRKRWLILLIALVVLAGLHKIRHIGAILNF